MLDRSLAQRLHSDRVDIFDRSVELQRASEDELALHEISCSACHLLGCVEGLGRSVKVSDFREHCQFCKILHDCQRNFAPDAEFIHIHYHGSITNVQICFRWKHRWYGCMNIHVQLYSLGSYFLLDYEC